MDFVRYQPGELLRLNRFNISEPASAAHIALVEQLDLMLVPLIAFDRTGHRLGMGKGYYDTALASYRTQRVFQGRPFLCGIGHTCQEVPAIPPDPWDLRLDAVLTEREWIEPV